MNNFNLMRAAGCGVEFLGGQGRLVVAVTWSDSMPNGYFWAFFADRGFRKSWTFSDISPDLFTQLPEATRKAVGVVVAKWDSVSELDDWPCAPVAAMLAELEQTPEGSPLDRALDPIAHGAAEHFPIVVAELAAREAREIAAAIPQPTPAPGRKSGRL